jgi:hypothetical protein
MSPNVKRRSKFMLAVKSVYRDSEQGLRWMLATISQRLLLAYVYLRREHRLLRLRRPETFDQKTRCADKFGVRSYVEENGLTGILSPLLGVFANSGEIDFNRLPERFVIKCTHGCKFNVICPDKHNLDTVRVRKDLDRWMSMDYGKSWGEVHYSRIKPRIICEEFLADPSGATPIDYKIYCFNGKALCTMVCTGRDAGETKFAFYDRGWKRLPDYCRPEVSTSAPVPRPDPYEFMIDAAERLARPFPFVRVDLYCLNGRVVFGEMTFTPSGGIDQDLTEAAQTAFGHALQLPPRIS